MAPAGVEAQHAAEISAALHGMSSGGPITSFDADFAELVTQWVGDAYRLNVPVPDVLETWIKSFTMEQVCETTKLLQNRLDRLCAYAPPKGCGEDPDDESFDDFERAVRECDRIFSALSTLADADVAMHPAVLAVHGEALCRAIDLFEEFMKLAGRTIVQAALGDRQMFSAVE